MRPTNAILKVTRWLSRSGKKLPEALAEIRQNWAQGKTVKLMFQGRGALWTHPGRPQLLGSQATTPSLPWHADLAHATAQHHPAFNPLVPLGQALV